MLNQRMSYPKGMSFKNWAQKQHIEYIQAKDNPHIISMLESGGRALRWDTFFSWWRLLILQSAVRRARRASATSDEAIARSYDEEYNGANPHYRYVSAILSSYGFQRITGIPPEDTADLIVLDVGAGSDEFLRFCHSTLNIPARQLHGSDVSRASKDIIERDGFTGYVGRIEHLALPAAHFGLVYLSYFIDYDTDQRSTFDSAVAATRPGGKIVLEGLFPCRPFGLLKKDEDKHMFVTQGGDATEDIALVTEAFKRLGKEQGRQISIERVVEAYRYVYSHYGLCKLPSYFITLSVK